MTTTTRFSHRFLALLAAILLGLPVLPGLPVLEAQSNYGAIRGGISDAQGAALDKAQVTLTSETTKLSRTTVSNGSGEYLFGAVDPGTYTLTVEIPGFQKLERKGIIVDSGNTIPLDLTLSIGSESSVIEVSAAEPLINAGTSYNGQLIDSQKLQNLPNPGRNPFLFSKLDNSVTAVGDPALRALSGPERIFHHLHCRGSNQLEQLLCRRHSNHRLL